ncbi:MAG TPA: PEP-CTERM sorting domain-containing protein [Kiritimatiellia bacterium]|nr:PEP-CTERM sorting domain-containing protein [Kiritimatiellia bacterium]
MKKIALVALIVAVGASLATAEIGTTWMSLDGFFGHTSYPNGLLNAGGSALAQLIFCGANGTIDLPDASDPHYVGGDDQWWADFTITASPWANFIAPQYTQSFVSGYYYVRVFDVGSPTAVTQGMWYFNGYTTNTTDMTAPYTPIDYNIDVTTTGFGETLNANSYEAVPEPATWAFMGLGALVMVLRRRFAK